MSERERRPIELSVASLPADGEVVVSTDEGSLVVCRIGSSVVAYQATCPHRGAPLADAQREGAVLRCPWHGATFDLRTGERLRGPDCPHLRTYEVAPRDDTLLITTTTEDPA